VKTLDKRPWSTETRRPGRSPWRRRFWFLVFVLLAALALYGFGYGLGAYLYSGTSEETNNEPEEQAYTPAIDQEREAPEPSTTVKEKKPVAPPPPEDPTLYLTVPRLGIQGHTVRNDRSEQALELGAIKLPSTGFPWEEGANTYIACHRLGFPNTESFNQCLNLPSMQKGDEVLLADSEGMLYGYRVSEVFTVGPDDAWVIGPVEGRDVVTLQTCTESPEDWVTLGPKLLESGPGSGRLIVRADRVA
jgi:sortase A